MCDLRDTVCTVVVCGSALRVSLRPEAESVSRKNRFRKLIVA